MTGADRIHVIDALRGLALLGILLVNILVFATPYYATGLPDLAVRSPIDQALYALITLLFETKFYLLFSFLFGWLPLSPAPPFGPSCCAGCWAWRSSASSTPCCCTTGTS